MNVYIIENYNGCIIATFDTQEGAEFFLWKYGWHRFDVNHDGYYDDVYVRYLDDGYVMTPDNIAVIKEQYVFSSKDPLL